MNKKLFFAASVLALGGMLSACGTDETSETTTEGTATETVHNDSDAATSEETAPEIITEEETEETEEVTDVEEPAAEEAVEESAEPATENSAVSEGTLTVSDSQSYEFLLLPGFEWTAEEPNKDLIYSSENDELFMRVETFKPEEADFNFADDSIRQTLKAVNEDAELVELPAFEEADFNNSALYEIPAENGKVTGIVFEKEELIVKVTIFDPADAGVTEDFIKMAKTITAQ